MTVNRKVGLLPTFSSAPLLVPVHIFEIEHSLLPDHAFGTVFLHVSVDLISP